MTTKAKSAPEGFSDAAEAYDGAVRHNIAGSERLVMSLPEGDYARVLDVGCGTGFASAAMLRRFDVSKLVGVDPAQGMLEVFGRKLDAFPGVDVELRAEDVMEMSAEDDPSSSTVDA